MKSMARLFVLTKFKKDIKHDKQKRTSDTTAMPRRR